MPPSLLPPTPEELEELRLRRRASQLKGYGEGVDDPTAQALLNLRRNLGEAGRAVVGAKPYDETNPTGSYRAVQALMNAPTPAAIIPEAAQAAGKAATALSGLGALGVVKPKGGNWLAGSVERGLRLFKRPDRMFQGGNEITLEQAMNWPGLAPVAGRDIAINNWIDTKLTKYIKNEMATPEDPVRALAERGVLHRNTYDLGEPGSAMREKRSSQGFPEEGMAVSPEAQFWEYLADRAIDPARAADFKYGSLDESIPRNNPWLEKVPDEAAVYSAKGLQRDLGFEHLIDELRNATDPDSGLPRSLQLSPEKLQKVTVPQAVELVDKINKWRAEQKVAADLKRSQNAATVEYKAYDTVPGTTEPNQRGLRWVELRKPEVKELPEGYSVKPMDREGYYAVYEPPSKAYPQGRSTGAIGKSPEEAIANSDFGRNALEESLKYEGETMGHCVGGYCPDVESGRSRIYSLRDAKGEPHVTIEVEPGRLSGKTSLEDWAQTYEKTHGAGTSAEFLANHPEIAEAFVPTIKQIKGKANRAPKDEYLPFVQDFVRSGQWSSVGDLRNTGLSNVPPNSALANALREAGEDVPKFMTDAEYDALTSRFNLPKYAAGGAVRMKKGGAVTDPNEPEVKRLPEPGLLTATMYAETAAREMYPKDPVKRDAARHMIASSILGQKLSPGTSRLLGELYEFKTSPLLHLKSAVGLGTPPPGYEMDKFNNALGSELQFRNQAELQRGVRQAVDTGRARLTPDEPAPYRRGGAVKIETNPTLMADELLFKGYRR
jgi:hypothetical protein